jgi:hypothetical protein
MKTCVKNNAHKNQKRRNEHLYSSCKGGVIKLPWNSRNNAYHEAGHTLIGYLLGVGIDYVTIDPEKCAPGIYGETKYAGGKVVKRHNKITQMLFMAGIMGQDHPGQRLEELLGAAEDLENCPYLVDGSRVRPFIPRNFRKEYPDLAKFCNVDRIVQAKIGERLISLTKDIIEEERASLELIANSLLEKKTLTGQQVHDLLKIDEQAKLRYLRRVDETMFSAVDEGIVECREIKKEEMRRFAMGQW